MEDLKTPLNSGAIVFFVVFKLRCSHTGTDQQAIGGLTSQNAHKMHVKHPIWLIWRSKYGRSKRSCKFFSRTSGEFGVEKGFDSMSWRSHRHQWCFKKSWQIHIDMCHWLAYFEGVWMWCCIYFQNIHPKNKQRAGTQRHWRFGFRWLSLWQWLGWFRQKLNFWCWLSPKPQRIRTTKKDTQNSSRFPPTPQERLSKKKSSKNQLAIHPAA